MSIYVIIYMKKKYVDLDMEIYICVYINVLIQYVYI